MGRDDLAQVLARPIAHRGLHACGAPGPVENSIGAAKAAAAAGFGIECDVQLSRDGEAMVFHDDTLDRLTGMPGRLDDHDAAALAQLRLRGGPDHMPRLAELLAAIDGRVPLVVEIKSAHNGDMRLTERSVAVLADYAGPVALESFDPDVVRHCRALNVDRPIGLVGPPEVGMDPDAALLEACDFLSWSIDDLARIATRHPTLPLSTWTVRRPEQVLLAARHRAQLVFEGFVPEAGR